jgi:hypothetical protein
MDSYYDRSMIHATYFWVFMKTNMGVFLECRNGSKVGMGGSSLSETWGDLPIHSNEIVERI